MYDLEQYWTEVAASISQRKGDDRIAGDNDPFYAYQRSKVMQLFGQIDFRGKRVLEVGCGPGGNLQEVLLYNPKALYGVDVSEGMLSIARKRFSSGQVQLIRTNGIHLPFEDQSIDLVYTIAVLQHNTNDDQLRQLMTEMARVCTGDIFLFERIETTVKGHNTNLGRPVHYYRDVLSTHGFQLTNTEFLQILVSQKVSGLIRRLANRPGRREGEPVSTLCRRLQQLVLPVTRLIDPLISMQSGIACMAFKRQSFQ